MAVNVGQRNVPDTPANRQLEACQKAMDLAIHTIQICKNKNIEEKTHITPLSKGFLWLGFEYRITDTGKVIMTLNSANIKHERKKLRKLVKLAKEGRITKAKVDECYKSWKANASKGNSYKLIQRMDDYYANLWEETAYEN